jgi:hypothetical protein
MAMQANSAANNASAILVAARSGLLVAKHPDNPEHERVLASTKSNLGPPMPALRYRLATPVKGIEELEDLWDVPAVDWLGECDLNATTLLAAPPSATPEATSSKVDEAMEWLTAALADGPQAAADLERAARSVGISVASLRRACAVLELAKEKIGFVGRWVWSLPDTATTHAAADDAAPKMLNAPKDAHPEKVSAFGLDERLWENTDHCPVTGGPHEYALLRDAQGRPVCVECGEPEPGPEADPDDEAEDEGEA